MSRTIALFSASCYITSTSSTKGSPPTDRTMRKTILLVISLLAVASCSAQADTTKAEPELLNIKEWPSPRLGMQGFYDTIDRRTIRRCTSKEAPVRIVTLMFQVNEKGRVQNVLPVDTVTIGECEEQAIRIMQKQRFKPGIDADGNKVTVTMKLPLVFRR